VIIRSASAAAARKRPERGGIREAGDRDALDLAVFVLAGLGELGHSDRNEKSRWGGSDVGGRQVAC
jgi:hypothetical protein